MFFEKLKTENNKKNTSEDKLVLAFDSDTKLRNNTYINQHSALSLILRKHLVMIRKLSNDLNNPESQAKRQIMVLIQMVCITVLPKSLEAPPTFIKVNSTTISINKQLTSL